MKNSGWKKSGGLANESESSSEQDCFNDLPDGWEQQSKFTPQNQKSWRHPADIGKKRLPIGAVVMVGLLSIAALTVMAYNGDRQRRSF